MTHDDRQLPATFSFDRVIVVAVGVLGVLVLLDQRMPRAAIVALAIVVGVAEGLGATLSIRAQPVSWLWLAGALSSLAIIATLLDTVVVAARAPWMKIAVRAVGSWLAAVSVLMLGWALPSV